MTRGQSQKRCQTMRVQSGKIQHDVTQYLLCQVNVTDLSVLLPRNGESQLFDKVRGHDIKLLRYLSVRFICDLMVENKKVKFGLK